MATSKIKLKLAGRVEDNYDVQFDAFIHELNAFKKSLIETDRVLTGKRTVTFRVVGLQKSSPALVEIEIIPVDDRESNIAPQIADAFTKTIDSIRHRREVPDYIDGEALRVFRTLAKPLGKSIFNLSVSTDTSTEDHVISETLEADIDAILGKDHYEYGSVTGRLEKINIHAGTNAFTIYSTLGGEKLRCVFADNLRSEAVRAVDRLVTVTGRMKFKKLDRIPYEIGVNEIQLHRHRSELATLGELRGVAPNATGNLSSEDFIRQLRDEWTEPEEASITE